MKSDTTSLLDIQRLVLDIMRIERDHRIPGTDRHENVVEHSFSLSMLCWRIFEMVKPPLNLEKILKYALVHDFSERGLKVDVNTYAGADERKLKEEREAAELKKVSEEFADFEDFVITLNDYEKKDAEALFVWSVDKMQAIIMGELDNWRCYQSYGISYDAFVKKVEGFIEKCSPYMKDVFKELYKESLKTYYDNPDRISR